MVDPLSGLPVGNGVSQSNQEVGQLVMSHWRVTETPSDWITTILLGTGNRLADKKKLNFNEGIPHRL